jgi:hypothetical protein
MQQARSKRIKPKRIKPKRIKPKRMVERVCAWSSQDERNADHDDEEIVFAAILADRDLPAACRWA